MNKHEGKLFEREFSYLTLPQPRDEFRRGEIPFAFENTFTSGTQMIAEQDDAGLGHVRFVQGGRTVFDIESILPHEYKMITPTYLAENPKKAGASDYSIDGMYTRQWKTEPERKIILLNDMQETRQLLLLLHEIGHATDTELAEIQATAKAHDAAAGETQRPKKRLEHLRKAVYSVAKRERRAWAFAVLELRSLADTAGFDMHEIFPTFKDLLDYIHTHLESYRSDAQGDANGRLRTEDRPFSPEIERIFHGSGPTKDEA